MKDQRITVQNNHVCTCFKGGKQTFLFTSFQERQGGFTPILNNFMSFKIVLQTLLFLQLK